MLPNTVSEHHTYNPTVDHHKFFIWEHPKQVKQHGEVIDRYQRFGFVPGEGLHPRPLPTCLNDNVVYVHAVLLNYVYYLYHEMPCD